MPARLAALQHWLGDTCGLEGFRVEPASGDASFRRYFRVTLSDGTTLIAMDAPPDREDSSTFVQVAERFREAGLHVPAIEALDLVQGFLLLEDLGSRHYLDLLDEASVEQLYSDALSALISLQTCGPQQGLPPYDAELLQREMALFTDWLLERHLGLALDDADQAMLEDSFHLLTESALAQPRVCVHRDYHSRNLLVPPAGQTPGIIDFQDAVIGPVTYDLVSLLKDCYIAWPLERVDHWAMGYFERAVQSGVLRAEHEAHFLHWFDLMGVQRHLKAAGIFARLRHRDDKSGYLKDIPRTLGYIVAIAGRHPELAGLARLIEQRVLPAL
jgi:aminoglycoside/choline kinase family phosphotransferase